MKPRYYHRDGTPYTGRNPTLQWAEDLGDQKLRVVRQDVVGDVEISTIWLGLDHSFGHGPPLIFETMVFPQGNGCWRYSTEDDAIIGHIEIVDALVRKQKLKD